MEDINTILNLEKAYSDSIIDNYGKEPTAIIMHPETSVEVINYYTAFYSIPEYLKDSTNIKFKGVRVYRSEDIEKGKFIIK